MSNILVLGDGLLGSELVNQTGWDYISRKKDGFDITDESTFHLLTETHYGVAQSCKYHTIINCIAHTDSYSNNKSLHWDVNYKGVSNLVEFCNKWGIKLIHISTEFVYANNPVPPTEEDLPQPQNSWYAYTKLLADEYIQLRSKNYLICRELHKANPFPYKEVWNVATSGDTVDKISNIIIELINQDIKGLYNVGTGDKLLKDIAPEAKEIVAPSYVPLDTRMNLNKLKSLN